MKSFYRFYRPVRFDERRVELITALNGGICLRFDENSGIPGVLQFNYARCRDDELFSKSVAKQIADHRFSLDHDFASVPFSENATVLAYAVIAYCGEEHEHPTPITHGAEIAWNYRQSALRDFGHSLRDLVAANQREATKAEIWRAGIAAAHYGDSYESLSR